jgi:hypothetical protein
MIDHFIQSRDLKLLNRLTLTQVVEWEPVLRCMADHKLAAHRLTTENRLERFGC